MDDRGWDALLQSLDEEARRAWVLGNCLDVRSQVEAWRESGQTLEPLQSVEAAQAVDSLDQAIGIFERLRDGQADEVIRLIQQALDELPPLPID